MKTMSGRWTVLLWVWLLAGPALAGDIQVLLGPPSVGQGGSNPLSIPPLNPLDYQLAYVTSGRKEWVMSVVPGLFFGQRFETQHFYAALGAGPILTVNGLGLGVSHAIAYTTPVFFRHFRYQVEYRQVIGLAYYGWQFPYAIRMGASYVF